MPKKIIIKLTVFAFLILNSTAYAMLTGLSFNPQPQNTNMLLSTQQAPYDKQPLAVHLHKKRVSQVDTSRFGNDLEVLLAGYRAINRSS